MTAAFNDNTMRLSLKNNSNNDMSVHSCRMCNNHRSFSEVEMPYAFKLLMQELQSINIVPRIITE